MNALLTSISLIFRFNLCRYAICLKQDIDFRKKKKEDEEEEDEEEEEEKQCQYEAKRLTWK